MTMWPQPHVRSAVKGKSEYRACSELSSTKCSIRNHRPIYSHGQLHQHATHDSEPVCAICNGCRFTNPNNHFLLKMSQALWSLSKTGSDSYDAYSLRCCLIGSHCVLVLRVCSANNPTIISFIAQAVIKNTSLCFHMIYLTSSECILSEAHHQVWKTRSS
jgi:hypothetical protein